MVTIDGSFGEGGGQILRTSLALSLVLVTGKPFSIHNIRAGRKKPGLMRQHLTAVNAAAEIGQAAIEGNRIDLLERGNIIHKTARASVANLPVKIANRELKVIRETLEWGRELLNAVNVENSQ